MNCDNPKYIEVKNFLIKLNEKLKDNCFISGSYVFEGDEVFKLLCDNNAFARIGQGRYLNGKPKSHNLHIFNKLFQAHKLNDNQNIILVKVHNSDYKGFKSYKQYEIDLENCALQYPCDTHLCQPKEENKIENKIENKVERGEPVIDINIDDQNIDLDTDMEDQEKETGALTDKDNSRINNLNNLTNSLKDNSASKNEDEVYCELNKENKKCCLFYRFHVQIPSTTHTSTTHTSTTHTYTFVKLETSPTIKLRDAFDHALHAAKHYFTKNGSVRKNTWSIRREDIAVYKVLDINGKETYIDSFKPSKIKKCSESTKECNTNTNTNKEILRFKPKLNTTILNKVSLKPVRSYSIDNQNITIDKIRLPYRVDYMITLKNSQHQSYNITTLPLYSHYKEDEELFGGFPSFETYNNFVRTRNEMFVPLGFYQNCLKTSGGSSNQFIKTNKHFFYNNRQYIVYKDKTTKQEYIKLNKTYTLCKSLKKQTCRKLQLKHLFNGQKYVVYETLKDNRRFIMINDRRRYI